MYVRKVAEVPHSSDEQVTEYASRAVAIANALDLDPADRAVLLPVIMGQIASKAVYTEQQQVGSLGTIIPNGAR